MHSLLIKADEPYFKVYASLGVGSHDMNGTHINTWMQNTWTCVCMGCWPVPRSTVFLFGFLIWLFINFLKIYCFKTSPSCFLSTIPKAPILVFHQGFLVSYKKVGGIK